MQKKAPDNGNKLAVLLSEAYALHQQKKIDAAQKLYRKILDLDKNNVNALTLLGSIYLERGAYREAVQMIQKSLALHAEQPVALCNLGLSLEKMDDLSAAMSCYNEAIRLQPNFTGAIYNRGALKRKMKQHEAALEDYNIAITQQPEFHLAHNNKGIVLTELGRISEAVASFNTAIEINSSHAETFNNRGVCYWKKRQLPEAISDYDKAITLKPDYISAIVNMATTLCELHRYQEARTFVKRALDLKSDETEALALQLEIATRQCDWIDFESRLIKIRKNVEAGNPLKPFLVVTTIDDPSLQQRSAVNWTASLYPPKKSPSIRVAAIEEDSNSRIRIAYLSADFHAHATAFLMAQVFELHDRSLFEIHAISIGNEKSGEMRNRIEKSFEHFTDASTWSDTDIVKYIHDHQIDILIDLKGYTQECRTSIIAQRAAPIQVSYLGYPGTMGASYIDYIIADNFVLPERVYPFFTEKVISLPDCYQCNDATRQIDEPLPTRSALGLPETGFLFCCFNQHYKYTPTVFAVWMRLLLAIPGSTLWLFVTDETAISNLRHTASKHNIDPARLFFADQLPLSQHLSRIRVADLFLDTLPCNAHTTASDALWAGVPLLTCAGNSFCARVAGSLLHALNLQELVTDNLIDYENRALDLARDPEKLAVIRKKLWQQRNTASLFDAENFTRKFERALRAIHMRRIAGLPLDHLRF